VRRLSPAFLTVAMLGVVGLLVVMYIGKKLLAREAPAPVDNRISVPMALADLEPGTRVTEAHLATGPADRSKIGRDVVLTSRVLVGRVVKNKITAAQPISSQDLYPPGESAPLQIDPGMVAVSVDAPGPFVARTHQYVNVHFTPAADPDSDRTGGSIMTLFDGVKVLAISGAGGGRMGTSVTLELTKEQANILLLARDKGTLNFTFAPSGKGTGVVGVSDEDRATLYEILGYSPEPPASRNPPVTTDVFIGKARSVNLFRDGRPIGWNDRDDDSSMTTRATDPQGTGSRRAINGGQVTPEAGSSGRAPSTMATPGSRL